MIEKVKINDITKAPLTYLNEIKALGNGAEFNFKSGINIIVGPNGCGKSSLLKLIEKYLLTSLDKTEVRNISGLFDFENKIYDGVDVVADYHFKPFRFCHMNEMSESGSDHWLNDFDTFAATYTTKHSSTGQGVIISLNTLFKRMFSQNASLAFPLSEIKENTKSDNEFTKNKNKKYLEYIESHMMEVTQENCEFTIILDEPDRNLDVNNLEEILPILSCTKERTQIVAVVHNPLLIYKLSTFDNINWIEMEDGYIEKVKKAIDKLVK